MMSMRPHERVPLPPSFAGARGTWPRPRCDCPTCGREMVLAWGNHRGPYLRHIPKRGAKMQFCNGGGSEAIEHQWAKQVLFDYLSQRAKLRFFSRCPDCEKRLCLEPVQAAPPRTVKMEHRLPTGGIADVAVCMGDTCEAIIEVMNTHRTATVGDSSGAMAASRPEPWYEVRANAVFRMLNDSLACLSGDDAEIEDVRLDRESCPDCMVLRRKRNKLSKWTLRVGKFRGSTFEEVSSDQSYCNWVLTRLVENDYSHMRIDEFGRFDPVIAFVLPKRKHVNATMAFPHTTLGGSLLAFAEYLLNDPLLYAIETKIKTILDTSLFYSLVDVVSAKRVWNPYKLGTKRADGVTLVDIRQPVPRG